MHDELSLILYMLKRRLGMKMLSRRVNHAIISCTVIVLLLFLALPVLSQAAEEVIPPCFNESELAQVREWEKTWVGKRVNGTNVDQVKDLLPEWLVSMMKEPEKWGAKELWFDVVPYRYCTPSKGMLEATKKYSPQTKFDPKGYKATWGEIKPNELLEGYMDGKTAGYPFPKPKTGLEMAWNFDANTLGDNHSKEVFGPVVNPRTGAERHSRQPQTYMYWTGRVDVAPTPVLPNNTQKLRRSMYQQIIEPTDMYGTNFLELIYSDQTKESNSFIWVAMYRRIRRMSSSQRGDTIDGTDHCYADGWAYADQINRQNFKFLEVREMLANRHQDGNNMTKQKGQAFWSGQQRERTKLYLVEAVCKDPDFVYSKELWYLDGETWMMEYKQIWDKKGKLWRCNDVQVGYLTSIQGNPVPFPVGYNYVDIQRYHGEPNRARYPKFGIECNREMFTVQYLQKGF